MNKSKVIIVNKNLIAGGIETAVLALIENIKNEVDIDLMLFNKCGALLDRAPKDIEIIEGGRLLRLLGNTYAGNPQQKAESNLARFKKKVLKTLNKMGARKLLVNLSLFGQKQGKDYDVAICCDGTDELRLKYVLKCTKSKFKIAFIHCDISASYISKNAIKALEKFDLICCVSQSCAERFKIRFPHFKNVEFLYNFQDVDRILKLSKQFDVEYKKGFNLVSVSRLSNEKAHLRSLKILKRLHDEGYNFVWNIVGDGEKELAIKSFIAENNMQDYIVMHGLQSNPYPYIKAADLFYLGSLHEAAPMVFCEAMSLGVAVLTTNTCSAEELVGDKGFICGNDEESIYNSLKEIFKNIQKIEEKRKKLADYSYNNKEITDKLLKLLKK